MTSNQAPECEPVLKAYIDTFSHYQLAHKWRYAPVGDKLINGQGGEYFKWKLFVFYGGFTPELSRQLGWEG